ncbi:MAG: hypothetical protein AAF533_14970 [Acidobacteriota bacterium]
MNDAPSIVSWELEDGSSRTVTVGATRKPGPQVPLRLASVS